MNIVVTNKEQTAKITIAVIAVILALLVVILKNIGFLSQIAKPTREAKEGSSSQFQGLSYNKQLSKTLLVIAHRGNSSEAPENTLAAIQEAFALGAGVIEVDVHLSRDGVPVVIHDDTVDRTTNGRGSVSQLTVAELKSFDAGSWKSPKYAGERIPTLAEVLQVANDNKGELLLDLKADDMGHAVSEVLRRANLTGSNLLVGTWTPLQARDFSLHLPQAKVLMATLEAVNGWDASYFTGHRARGISGFEILADNLSAGFIAGAHAHSMSVYAYTVNDELAMRKLIRMGVDGIETDVPGLLARLPLRLFDLPAPTAYSAEAGLKDVKIAGLDLHAHPPSGAIFSVKSEGRPIQLVFTPSFVSDVPRDKTDGVTFEIRHGEKRLYESHILPTEHVAPVTLNISGVENQDVIQLTFITSPGRHNDASYDWAVWGNVKIVVAPSFPRRG